MELALLGSRLPLEVKTITSAPEGSGPGSAGADGLSALIEQSLNGEFGQVDLLHQSASQHIVEAGHQFASDGISSARLFKIRNGLGGQDSTGQVTKLRVVSRNL